MKRRLAVVLLLAGVASVGSQAMQGSGATTAAAASSNSVTKGDCEDDEWICGDSYEIEGKKYQDCFCPVTGLWIRRPLF
jgi:hypothetical protein